MAGFNRRFAPMTEKLVRHSRRDGTRSVVIRVNADPSPHGHWSLGVNEGGRIVGEACHFVDLAMFLTASVPQRVHAFSILGSGKSASATQDSLIQIPTRNGTPASILYLADRFISPCRGRIACHGGGKSAVIEDICETVRLGAVKIRRSRAAQGQGRNGVVAAFCSSMDTGYASIPPNILFSASEARLAIGESISTDGPKTIADHALLDKHNGQ
jgi:predicted dehydrogenase